MSSLKRASDILPIIIELKDCILKETDNSGIIKISQELLNGSLQKKILNLLNNQIKGYKCNFFKGEFEINIIPIPIKIYNIQFVFNKGQYKIIADCDIPFFEKITYKLLKIQLSKMGKKYCFDLETIEAFKEFKNTGFYNIDILNTTEIEYIGCADGFLTFSYEFI